MQIFGPVCARCLIYSQRLSWQGQNTYRGKRNCKDRKLYVGRTSALRDGEDDILAAHSEAPVFVYHIGVRICRTRWFRKNF